MCDLRNDSNGRKSKMQEMVERILKKRKEISLADMKEIIGEEYRFPPTKRSIWLWLKEESDLDVERCKIKGWTGGPWNHRTEFEGVRLVK